MEVETEGPKVQGHPELHKTILGGGGRGEESIISS